MWLCVITARLFACNRVRPSELVASKNHRQHSTKRDLITARAPAQSTASQQTVAASHRGIIAFAYSISGQGHFLPLTLLFWNVKSKLMLETRKAFEHATNES